MISRVETISVLLENNLHFAEDGEDSEGDIYIEGLVRLRSEARGFRVHPLRPSCRSENPPAWRAIQAYLGDLLMDREAITRLAASIAQLNDESYGATPA